jgi:ABC-type multidrug transport system fused ATPase/permease subunit
MKRVAAPPARCGRGGPNNPSAPADACLLPSSPAAQVTLALPRPPPCFTDVLELEGVATGWGSPDDGRPPVVSGAFPAPGGRASMAKTKPRQLVLPARSNPLSLPPTTTTPGVSCLIQKGHRVLVLGPNGAGKSTLLKTVGGAIEPWAGRVKLGEGAKLGVFSQDLAQVAGGGEEGVQAGGGT